MARSRYLDGEPEARPLIMLVGTVLLVGCLLIVSRVVDNEPSGNAACEEGGGGGSGRNIGVGVPNAPLSGYEGGSPLNDGGPAVTIIQDVRETMNRLPLDRNNPEKYDPKPRPKPR